MAGTVLVRLIMVMTVLMGTARALLPTQYRTHKQWPREQVQRENSTRKDFTPAIAELKSLIENNTRINMLFTQMLDDDVPIQRPFSRDPLNQTEIRDYYDLLEALNQIITEGPQWSLEANDLGLLAAPIVTILDYPMSTPAGYAVFLEPDVNQAMQAILNEWGKFLSSPESAGVLNESEQGWLGPDALRNLMAVANAPYKTNYTFGEFFQSNPNAQHYGFSSWDDFFTRSLRNGVRPTASPDNDNVILNACESQPYNFQTNVQLRSKFWIKSQPYSVQDMLAYDDLADSFAGGTVYQAYLSPLSYHRWHAPVSGKVVKAFVQEGYYFSEPLFENKTFEYEIDDFALNSQGYLSAIATRGIIFIEADNPAIGLMAFIAVGNYEVSTAEITVQDGQHIEKGQETGLFHFGGSSYVVLFRQEVHLEGFPSVETTKDNVPVRGQLAVVKPSNATS